MGDTLKTREDSLIPKPAALPVALLAPQSRSPARRRVGTRGSFRNRPRWTGGIRMGRGCIPVGVLATERIRIQWTLRLDPANWRRRDPRHLAPAGRDRRCWVALARG